MPSPSPEKAEETEGANSDDVSAALSDIHVGEDLQTSRVVVSLTVSKPPGTTGAFHITNLLNRIRALPDVVTVRSVLTGGSGEPVRELPSSSSSSSSRNVAITLAVRIASPGMSKSDAGLAVGAALGSLVGVVELQLVSVDGMPVRFKKK